MCKLRIEVTCDKLRMRTFNFIAGTSRAIAAILSCPAGNNLRKIRLVTLRAFLGLLHTSAGFERGQRWPYMDVLTSTWLQLQLSSITIIIN